MRFSDFGLEPKLLENIEKMGFTEATPIQSEVIPLALAAKDVSGLSKTGTGKTAAFLIPLIHRLATGDANSIILCIAPTRELATQIEAEAKKLSEGMNLGTVSVIGGMSSADQGTAINAGARIVIGTPGRLIDLYKERVLDLSRVQYLVFDEADRMFDMGFIKDMRYLLSKIPATRQILLFSATLNFSVLHLIYEFGSTPTEVNVSRDQMTADGIQQVIYQVADDDKPKALLAVCRKYATTDGYIIVFSSYKERVAIITAFLTANGIPAQGLSSLMRQEKRNKIIQGFRTGKFRALVATDVASRGLDIDNVDLVVNFHLPEDAATYVHRIGRTARAGKSGIAVSIASGEDAYNQIRVEEFLGKKLPVEWFGEKELEFDVVWPKHVEQDEDDEDMNDRPRRGREQGGRRPPSDRGPRPAAGARGPRPDRPHARPRPTPTAAAAVEGAEVAAAPASTPVPRPAHPRAPREAGREPRHSRDRGAERRPDRDRGPRRDDRPRDNRRPPVKAPADMPSPLTGNPVIYCMKTGKAKNRSAEEVASLVAQSKRDGKAPLLKKIKSRVSALFSAKK